MTPAAPQYRGPVALFKRKAARSGATGAGARGTASTDAGGIVVWSRDAFAQLTPETWDDELCEDEDIARHIAAGDLVPIFMGFDGAYAVEVRAGEGNDLSDRERRYLGTEGRGAYRLVVGSKGAWVSGLEEVGPDPELGFAVPLRRGTYAAELAMIGWDDEPGAVDEDDKPADHALPDFVVRLREAVEGQPFATALEAFERPA